MPAHRIQQGTICVMHWNRALAAIAFLLLAGGRPGDAAEPRLIMSDAVVDSAGTALLHVELLAAGESLSAIQFDITYPSQRLDASVSLGPSVDAAKQLWTAGVSRILIAGINQKPMGNGPILGLLIHMKAGTPAGRYPITMTAISAADSSGSSVVLGAVTGSAIVPGTSAVTPAVRGVANAANWMTGAVAPGEIVVIGGDSMANDGLQTAQLTIDGRVATVLGDTSILFDGV